MCSCDTDTNLVCAALCCAVQAIVRLVVFCILLATAGAVTKLMAMNMEAARSVVWDNTAMASMIKLRMQVRVSLHNADSNSWCSVMPWQPSKL